MSVERREYRRAHLNLPIKLSDKGFDAVTETRNISGNGVYCSVNKDIPLMAKLQVILLVPLVKNKKKVLKRLTCEGVVVRREPAFSHGKTHYNIAIYFSTIKETDRKALLSYINSSGA